MTYSTHIEIDRSALIHNLEFIRSFIGPDVIFSSVVKGNAYGHGIENIVSIEQTAGVNHFSVFNAQEALRVKNISKKGTTILVMGMLTDDQLAWAIESNIQFFVFNTSRLQKAHDLGVKMKKKVRVHLEIETGMNRTGFSPKQINEAIDFITNSRSLIFQGLCTHFAGAESISNYYRVEKQKKTYWKMMKQLKDTSKDPELFHVACSAAALRYPGTLLDLVRIGILQYGFFPSKEVQIDYMSRNKVHTSPLKRIVSWKSTVMNIKSVKRGEFVGYGTSYFANEDMRIAIIPVGYSHGFSRSLSNQGRVIINGEFAPVVGMVNMNMISVDVTNIDVVNEGDEVVLIGKQGEREITVDSFSEYTNQVNYELLTRLSVDIPRLIVN